MDSNEIKKMDLTEFRDKGYLLEVNRQFFHPLGLALEVTIEDDQTVSAISGIWDYREDPEGMLFADLTDVKVSEQADKIKADRLEKEKIRMNKYGFSIQPIGHKLTGEE